MKIKGRVMEISNDDLGNVLFIVVGQDENGIGRRVEIPVKILPPNVRLGDEATVEIDGEPMYFQHPAPKQIQ